MTVTGSAFRERPASPLGEGKTIVLNFGAKASAAVRDMAAATLESGGFDAAIAEPETLAIGDRMPDGTVYAGMSPDTGNKMYVTPADAPSIMAWEKAKEYATRLDAHGHRDWHLPTKGELNVLFNNRAAIGGFTAGVFHPDGWYWSGTQAHTWDAWGQRVNYGYQRCDSALTAYAVRCVR